MFFFCFFFPIKTTGLKEDDSVKIEVKVVENDMEVVVEKVERTVEEEEEGVEEGEEVIKAFLYY